jgi:hypothetical protein
MNSNGSSSGNPDTLYSISPTGEKFELPSKKQDAAEYRKIALSR